MKATTHGWRSRLHKLAWGTRAVGVPQTARGTLRLGWLFLRRPAQAEVVLRSGGVITFDNPSQRAPALVVFGDVIDPELQLVRRLLKPGALVVDAGAAIGQFTVVAGQTPGVTIHAYEPSSANLVTLRRNVEANRITDRVAVHQAALAASEGWASFQTAPNTFLSQLAPEHSGGNGETVPVHTLSGEMNRLTISQVDILKVNVAGFEADVLAGAMPLLESGRVSLLIVLIGSKVVPILRRIAALGYAFYFFDPYTVELHPLDSIDEKTLHEPPTPARHVIGIHPQALSQGALATIPIRRGAGAS